MLIQRHGCEPDYAGHVLQHVHHLELPGIEDPEGHHVVGGVVADYQELAASVEVKMSGEGSLTGLDVHQAEAPRVGVSLVHGDGVVAPVTHIQEPNRIT